MIPIITIIAAYFIYFVIEVFHDDVLRLVRNKGRHIMIVLESATSSDRNGYKASQDIKQDDIWNSQWHKLDWFGHALISLLITFLVFWFTNDFMYFLLIATIGSERVLTLNIGGNIKAKRKTFYLGNGWWDRKFHGNEKLYHIVVFAVFVANAWLLIWNAT